MHARSAFSIQRDVIFAIFIREMNSRFNSYTFGNIWILLEPILMLTMFILIFGMRGRGEFGYVEPPVFIFAAFLPFKILWQATMKLTAGAYGAARGLLGFRQVRLFDIFLARILLEGGVFLIVGVVLGSGLMWLGLDVVPNDPLGVLKYCSMLWIFAGFFGILVGMVSRIAKEVEKVINLLTMPLLFLSAVFFPMTVVPPGYAAWLSWNPLVHAMELIREAWFSAYVSPVADVEYLLHWVVAVVALAMSSYRLFWQKVTAS